MVLEEKHLEFLKQYLGKDIEKIIFASDKRLLITSENSITQVPDHFIDKIINENKDTKQMKDGLTPEEDEIMNSLVNAWNKYVKLEVMHPSDNDDFIRGIHLCQYVLSMRILRRDYPNRYPTHNKKVKLGSVNTSGSKIEAEGPTLLDSIRAAGKENIKTKVKPIKSDFKDTINKLFKE